MRAHMGNIPNMLAALLGIIIKSLGLFVSSSLGNCGDNAIAVASSLPACQVQATCLFGPRP